MKKIGYIVFLVVFSAGFVACKKDDAAPVSRTSLLVTPKFWKISAWTVTPGLPLQDGTTITDLYTYSKPTSRDDILKFNHNPATYIHEEGATKANGAAQIIDVGNWFLSIDEKGIVLASTRGNQFSYNIVELTGKTLKLTYEDADNNGNVRTYTRTYTAQ